MDIIQRSKRVNLCKFFFLGKRMNTKKNRKHLWWCCDFNALVFLLLYFPWILFNLNWGEKWWKWQKIQFVSSFWLILSCGKLNSFNVLWIKINIFYISFLGENLLRFIRPNYLQINDFKSIHFNGWRNIKEFNFLSFLVRII